MARGDRAAAGDHVAQPPIAAAPTAWPTSLGLHPPAKSRMHGNGPKRTTSRPYAPVLKKHNLQAFCAQTWLSHRCLTIGCPRFEPGPAIERSTCRPALFQGSLTPLARSGYAPERSAK